MTVQIGLALMLLIGAGLMANSFLRVLNTELGADPTNLLTFEFRFAQDELMQPVGTYRGVGLWEIDSSKPAGNIRTVEQYLGQQARGLELYASLLGIFGAAAGLLAALGIYGVMAYTVAQRTREIGIRVALGASAARVMRLVSIRAMAVIGIGLMLGLAGAMGLTRFLQSELFEVSPTDPLTFTVVTVGVTIVALLACLISTRRAVRVDPAVALRYE